MKNAARAYHYDLDQGRKKYCIDVEIVGLIRCALEHDYSEKCWIHINSNHIGKHLHYDTYAVTLAKHSHYEYDDLDLNREKCGID